MENKNKFTPGPWTIGHAYHEIPTAGTTMAIHEPGSSDNGPVYAPVCWVNGNGKMETGANARLIAAAPDMLAVCEEMVHGDGTIESLQKALDLANIAIAKALGA